MRTTEQDVLLTIHFAGDGTLGEIYMTSFFGVGMMVEMGALMTGIILAGRTGAAIAAQLGTKQVSAEIARRAAVNTGCGDSIERPADAEKSGRIGHRHGEPQ